ncbi:unnamed protein product [Linum trigynum]
MMFRKRKRRVGVHHLVMDAQIEECTADATVSSNISQLLFWLDVREKGAKNRNRNIVRKGKVKSEDGERGRYRGKEISRSLSQLILPAAAAAVAEEKEERRVANREREKEWAKSLISRSKRLPPSYLSLPSERKSKSKSSSTSILNTSCVSVAVEECDFAVGRKGGDGWFKDFFRFLN